MADMSEYEKSMELQRRNKSVDERRTSALEQIADHLWAIHMEMIATREKMPRPPAD